ncbi:hypothetical protein CLV78_107130 [Aliiruegeria haliotis]|uniref:Uncharacterized protein n=1 Tax=Aliiruegeria haliotis TaxID=1280846 RepID=A0A2T0RLY5_9RHOB|nr:hypothetical protein [Aliiruegeria haliotis]PRY22206.1 hypothetical protein CLV78_107130 [Aliiruegeria haliotis]
MTVWTRIKTRNAFVEAIGDKCLKGDGMEFILHSDGRISGMVEGRCLTGKWVWRDTCFCREARLNNDDLSTDCEIIEICGNRMRYTRNRGRGESSIVSIG